MKRILMAIACVLLATGCYTNPCTIDSQPQGASIYLNNQFVGKTPFTAQIGAVKVPMKVELEGYYTDTRDIVSTQDQISGTYTTPSQVFVRLAKKEESAK